MDADIYGQTMEGILETKTFASFHCEIQK